MKADPVIKRMLSRFQLSADESSDNRNRGLEALKFYNGGKDQWDKAIYDLRYDQNQPRDSFNQIPQFVHQVTNDMRMNMPQTKFIPANEGSVETAEVLEDLVRNIQSSSEGEVAYDAAAQSQVIMGQGYWRYVTEYENEDSFDQVIKLRWVPNPFTIYDDVTCINQDRLDRKWLIEVADISVKDLNRDHSKNYGSSELSSIGDASPDWAGTWDRDNEDGIVRIAEYWEVKESIIKLYRSKNGKTSKVKPKGVIADEDVREVVTSKVIWRKCTALEVLEEREWPGSYIPYVFVAGEQLNIDGKWVISGLVEHMMAPQRLINYATNTAIELFSLAPRAPYIVDIESIEGFEDYYDEANIKNYPYLPYRSQKGSKQFQPPQRAQNSADLGSAMAVRQMAQETFYSTTGIYPASLGQQSNEKSGKAILARQKEGDVATFHFTDNIARGLRAGGRILKDLIPKIYDAARVVTLLKEDKSNRKVKINQRFVDEDGQTKEFDLTTGDYDVAVTTGPSYSTKRQEAAESMTQLVQAAPQLMVAAPDLVVGSYDFPGAQELSERLKKTLPPGLADEPKKGEIPPQVQAQMQQMQELVQMGAQQIEQLQGELQSKEADYQLKQADLQLKMQDMQYSAQSDQLKAETDRMKLALDAEKLQLERDKAELEGLQLQLQARAPQAQQLTQSQPEEADVANMTREALVAQLQKLDEDDAMQAQQAEQQQQSMLMQAQKEQEEAMGRQMMLEQLVGIQAAITQLTQSIAAPKQIVRDPNTGLVAGVVNA